MVSLLDLPPDVLEKILAYLSYDELSHSRMVCKTFDAMGQMLLNRGFHKVEKFHNHCLRKVKSQLPRRESERRKHPLSRHCDILTAIETRISLLGMTFVKFMELKFCCFIPGKVLDEIYRVLRYVLNEQSPIRAHEVLQELRDLSSMAMEYFDEKIVPTFKSRAETTPRVLQAYNILPGLTNKQMVLSFGSVHMVEKPAPGAQIALAEPPPPPPLPPSTSVLQEKLRKVTIYMKMLTRKYHSSARDILAMDQKLLEISKKSTELEKKVGEQQNLLASQEEKIKEQNLLIEVMSKQLAEGVAFDKPTSESSSEGETSQKRKLRPRPSASSSWSSNLRKKLKR